MLAILLAGTAPGMALLSYFYLKDKYEPEPVLLVVRTFLFGALLMLPVAFIEYVLDIENIGGSELSSSFLSTGMLEESFKWIVLFYSAYRHVEFDEPFDGIVYGTSVSLGFATAENILYLLSNGVEYALNRALFPVSSHALFGVIMGYYLSRAKFASTSKWGWMILSISIPAIMHGIFNYILIKQNAWLTIMIPYMIFLWWFGMKKIHMAEILSKAHFSKQYSIQKILDANLASYG
ncbi:glutamic-type intramembrane protease PrsW [Bacillota bacterium Lsc_1132]